MRLPFRRIRDRTIALVCVASLLPVILLGLFIGARLRGELTSQALRSQERVVEAIRQGIFMQLTGYSRQLAKLAEDPGLQSMEAPRQKSVILRFLDQNPSFFSVFVLRLDGTINSLLYRNRFAGDDQQIGTNIFSNQGPHFKAFQESFRKVLDKKQTIVNESISNYRQRNELLILLPIRSFTNPERLEGVMSCGLNLDGVTLQELLGGFGGASGFLLLTDRLGNIMARKGQGIPQGLNRVDCSTWPENRAFFSTNTSLDNRDYIVTIGAVPGANGFIFLAAPRDEILGFVRHTLVGMIILTLISLGVAVGFGIWSAGELSRPIAVLLEGIHRVAEGAVSHRISDEAEGDGELAEACRAFNDMAERLEKNQMIEDVWSKTWKPPS